MHASAGVCAYLATVSNISNAHTLKTEPFTQTRINEFILSIDTLHTHTDNSTHGNKFVNSGCVCRQFYSDQRTIHNQNSNNVHSISCDVKIRSKIFVFFFLQKFILSKGKKNQWLKQKKLLFVHKSKSVLEEMRIVTISGWQHELAFTRSAELKQIVCDCVI